MKVEALVALLLLAATASTDAAAPAAWTTVQPGLVVTLPRDHGAHPGTLTEWWYLTGIVHSESEGAYGVQLTFFRRGLDPNPPAPGSSALRARHALAAHFAVADLRRGRLLKGERVRRLDGMLAGASASDLHVWLDGWELRRHADDTIAASATDPAAGTAIDLRLRPVKQLVRHGNGGYSRKGADPGNASAYLSWTRLAVSGDLTVGGRRFRVSGAAWFDHEWGTSQLGEGVVGWNWFGLRLADGRELMTFVLRRHDGAPDPFSAGTLVSAGGVPRALAADDFRIEALATWRSPASGARYPARWRILVPSAELDIIVAPRLQEAEIDARGSTGTIYWEGPVDVSGTAAGEGYAELTGYAGSLAGVFSPAATQPAAP